MPQETPSPIFEEDENETKVKEENLDEPEMEWTAREKKVAEARERLAGTKEEDLELDWSEKVKEGYQKDHEVETPESGQQAA